MSLAAEPDWAEIRELGENWTIHKYYKAYALYLIDELLTGSASHKLSAGMLERLLVMIYEEGIGAKKEDYDYDDDDAYNLSDEEKEQLAARTREEIDLLTYHITNNIRDILYENAVNEKLPDALRIDTSKGTYFFSVYE